MKKIRTEKGITLVALIITIVVLLILATVAITSMQESDVIGYTNNAATKYNGTVTNEGGTLGEYENFLSNHSSGTGGGSESGQTLSTPTISITGDTLTITPVENATSYDIYVDGLIMANTTSVTANVMSDILAVNNSKNYDMYVDNMMDITTLEDASSNSKVQLCAPEVAIR